MRLFSLCLMVAPVAASAISPEWTAEKCDRYTRAWHMATDGLATGALSDRFIADHDAFLDSGCTIRGAVCPMTTSEYDLANMLSLMAVAEGATGSFLPFHCTPTPVLQD
ncbi:hypothetical protein [Pacificibacter marinus]|uniref:hypothetical protein n=1 Tax=Pacificibacter marinus TaxID=658057 RepID=UPI001C0721D3|nr:hypothetical protein [Pacificibacter marinus]MBU2869045.1 hypothetical protein [Pacificibacter marinus]